jgi:threonine 3-dehydrogenase
MISCDGPTLVGGGKGGGILFPFTHLYLIINRSFLEPLFFFIFVVRSKFGIENVIATDIRKPMDRLDEGNPFLLLDVADFGAIKRVIEEKKIDTIVHLAALLSGRGEMDVDLAMRVNIDGFRNVLILARDYQLKLYCPSTIGAFGPGTPRVNTPDVTVMNPTTIYGVSKVFAERLGEYFYLKYGVDFRSLRYPGIISADSLPGFGATDYAVEIFHSALKYGTYRCFLHADTELPMMYMPDCLEGTLQFLEAPNEKLTLRVYNMASMNFTPRQLAREIEKHIPNFKMTYIEGDFRQSIADSWPRTLDDSRARQDWNWKPRYDLSKMVKDMFDRLKGNITIPSSSSL